MKNIYTIGHSNQSIESFIEILKANDIHCLVDVRSYPSSKYVPHFNKNNLEHSLKKEHIKYFHLPDLGGRRKKSTTIHKSIRVDAFAGYADYMMTLEFKKGVSDLKKIARKCRTAFMCTEAVWWQCHRRMIADRLILDGWNVYHLGIGKKNPLHQLWDIARLDENDNIIYDIK